jgi:multisubunit Na+/H+ antiporter MnhG subunit
VLVGLWLAVGSSDFTSAFKDLFTVAMTAATGPIVTTATARAVHIRGRRDEAR